MITLMRIAPVGEVAPRAAFGKIELPMPIHLKKKGGKLAFDRCYVPIVSSPSMCCQTNLFKQPRFVSTLASGGNSYRWAHTDVTFPDMTDYRKDSTKDPWKKSIETEDQRRMTHYLAYAAGGMIGLYMTKYLVRGFVEYKGAPKSMEALASVEINLNDVAEGKSCTYMWRGKPIFVRHRTQEQIETERAVDVSSLRDPESDEKRTKKPEWLVVIGVCTHLGCVPLANAGNFGGYYCPCHGSHYDASGRIRQGPAPLNLEVPAKVEFTDDNKLIIG